MKAVLLTLGTVGMVVYLTGCMPQTLLYQAEPVSNHTVWYSGEQFQTETKDSLTVSVAFENELGGTMTFYIVVGNDGGDTVLAAPEQCYYYGTYLTAWYKSNAVEDYATLDSANVVDTIRAINPEGELLSIDEQMLQANATYATNAGINAAGRILQIVGDVATIGKNKTEEQQKDEQHLNHSLNKSEAENAASYNSTVSQLSNERDYWQNATLRKTTLFPNTAIAGKVCFPVDKNLQSFKLVVPIDTTIFEFDFKQTPVTN